MDRLKARFPVYSRLLRLYPASYRDTYGEQMLQMLADMLDDPERRRSAVWLRTVLDFPLSVSKQQVIYTGAAMTHSTPNYMKRNTLLGAILLLPFPAAVIASKLYHGTVAATSAWSIVWLWVFTILPAIAFALCLGTLLYWLFDKRQPTSPGFWKRVADIRHNGLVTVVAGLGLVMALFLPFHDSVHCVVVNPIHKVTHLRQTWECIQHSH